MELQINDKKMTADVPGNTPLLWVIRDEFGLTGTKYGCGMSLCGACTVYIDGEPARACVTPVSAAAGKKITTIEGLNDKVGQAVIQAWIEQSVPQCGYCQSGQIMSAAALLRKNKKPSDDEIASAMDGNICRCGTYTKIKEAIHKAALTLR